jgi:hypothetical protein
MRKAVVEIGLPSSKVNERRSVSSPHSRTFAEWPAVSQTANWREAGSMSVIAILRQPSHMEAQRDVSLLTDGRKRLVEQVGGDMVA